MKKVLSFLLCMVILTTMVLSASAIASVEIKGLKVDKTSLMLDVGAAYGLSVTFTPVNTTQKLLVFSTSNANVATIDKDGVIKAAGGGKAVITVASKSNGKISAKVNVTVTKKKPVTLRIEVYDRGNAGGTAPDNNYWTKWIQANYGDKNNVTLKFETCPRFDNNAKLQMWFAAGTAPDLCYVNEIEPYTNFRKNGGLATLDDSLNKYGTQLKEFMGPLLGRGINDGKQYSIVAKRVVDAQITTWIRQDWLDKLNMPAPKTVEEFYNTMKAFKEKNPDKMGKVVPFCLNYDAGWMAWNLLESFKTDKTDYSRFVTQTRNMLMFAPGVKDGIKLLNKMYNEGLVSKEFPLDTQNNIWHSDVINGFAGCFLANYDYPLRSNPGLLKGLKAKYPDAKIVPIDPFKDKDGITTKRLADTAGIRSFVPKTSENKTDEVIKYLNWMTNKDVLFFLQYGEEGKNHTMQNGYPVIVPATGETIMNSANNIDYTMIVNGVIGKDKEDTMKRNSLAYSADLQQLYIDGWKMGVVNGYDAPENRTNEVTDADAKYGAAMAVKGQEFYAKTITCKESEFEDVWNQQINSMLRAGASAMLTERKALYKKVFPTK